MSGEDRLFGAIYGATDKPDWAVSDLADAVRAVLLDDATVERAADILLQGDLSVCECRRSPLDKHDVNPPCSTRKAAIEKMRRVLSVAVQEER